MRFIWAACVQHEIIAFNFEIFSFICHFLSQSSWINSSYNSHSYTECQNHHHQHWSNLLTARDHLIAVLVVAEADVDVNINLFNNASLINNINRLKSVINWYNQIFLSIINLEVAITSEIMFIHGLSTSSEYQGWKIFSLEQTMIEYDILTLILIFSCDVETTLDSKRTDSYKGIRCFLIKIIVLFTWMIVSEIIFVWKKDLF